MSDILKPLDQIPELSFINNATLAGIESEMIADYEARYTKLTGEPCALSPADPAHLIIQDTALKIYQCLQYIDRGGKQSLLKYSYGEYLDNLAALKKAYRNPATAATVTLRFTLSAARPVAVGIPAGVRATSETLVYFATNAYAEIPAGDLYVDVKATCTTAGVIGNGLAVGELDMLVDPIGYVESVSNSTKSEGGADIEDDESFRERVFLIPSSYSTAGPCDAYMYWIKTFNSDIGDVKVTSTQAAGRIDVCFLMKDGTAPGAQMINDLNSYLLNNEVRPMTDDVHVSSPTDVSYNIACSYYISRTHASVAASIQASVAAALAEYIKWQRKIGRDINPSELTKRLLTAGAKRAEITAPVYTTVDATAVASIGTQTLTYGGLEDD